MIAPKAYNGIKLHQSNCGICATAAMLLVVPLTLYHIICHAARLRPAEVSLAPGSSLLVLCLGAHNSLPAFATLNT